MDPTRRASPVAPVCVAAFVAAVHLAWWLLGAGAVDAGILADGDGYARLLRVERLLAGSGWLDNALPRAQWPDGGSLHWTRIFDALLIVLASPMMPVLGVKAALYWSGAVISPILHVVTALALAWAARPLLGRTGGYIAGALTVGHPGVLGYAVVGHADHHVLIGLFSVLAFGFLLRALSGAWTGAAAERLAACGGVALAAAYWVSVEAQVTAGLWLAGMGLVWLTGEHGAARRNLALALGLGLGLSVALMIERGLVGFLDVEYDRVSIVHLTGAGLVASFWAAIVVAERFGRMPTGLAQRVALAVLGAAAAAAVLSGLFDRVFTNPLADVDPRVQAIFYFVREYQPIGDVAHFLLYLGGALIAVPWAIWRLRTVPGGAERWMWLLALAFAAVYVTLTTVWVRWAMFGGLFVSVLLADFLVRIDAALDRGVRQPARTIAKVGIAVAVIMGPMIAGGAAIHAGRADNATPERAAVEGDVRACPMKAMAAALNRPPWAERPRVILASANFGPEILYRTRHRVTATLHHRHAGGILDGALILGGDNEDEIRRLVRRREIDLILLCPHSRHDGYFFFEAGPLPFYLRLQRGDVPAWMRAVDLPPDLAVPFRLFEVVRD